MSKNTLDLLLAAEIAKPQVKRYRHKRLSKLCGGDVVFVLREIGYTKVADIRELHDDDGEMDVHIVLATVAEPDLSAKALREKYGAATPAELVRKLLLPGEIADLARKGEQLCGYRIETLEDMEELEKNSKAPPTTT